MTAPSRRWTKPLARAAIGMGLVVPAMTATSAGAEGRYEFLAPPSTQSNRIYRVDTKTGAMGVCWFNGTHTECMTGSGLAGAQAAGRYTLRRGASTAEKGVFRVDLKSGSVSNCWVKQGALVCTFPAQ